jgi:glucose/arabinose dehydrogenase
MSSRHHFLAALSLAVLPAIAAAQPIPAKIPHGPAVIRLQPVVSGLTAPLTANFAPGDPSRMFVVEQAGTVKLVQNGVVQATPFLDASATTVPMRSGYDERGFLGMAFDPNFNNAASPGFRRLFTWTSDTTQANPTYPLTTPGTVDHQNVLSSWKVSAANPNVVDPASRQVLLRIDHPSFNHDAGDLRFGPDGYLYFGDGDGGGANDTGNGHNPATGNAQDVNSPLGKIHRIDVYGNNRGNYGVPADNPFAGGGGVPEMYAKGFRNPYRFSFDGTRLLVADVGQNNIEEVDDVIKNGHYGWNVKEGTFLFNPANGTVGASTPGSPAGLIDPLIQYDHDEGIAIVGGFVYRGSKMPSLQGKYVFGDFSSSFGAAAGRLFYADLATGQINEFVLANGDLPLGMFVKGMSQGPNGELYLLASTVLAPTGTTGQIFEIVPEPTTLAVACGIAVLLARRPRRAQ